jgi:uncharacterized protein YqeY
MGLREQLRNDLNDAMRQKDKQRKTTIRLILSAINKAESELDSTGERVHLDDKGILAVISKETKIRQESIVEFGRGGREDLVAEAEAELAILQTYLPTQLTRQEIELEAQGVIKEVGASGPHDIGKVMKPLMSRFQGRADGKLVNQVVRELLGE